MKRFQILAALVVAGAIATAANGQSVTLRYLWPKGESRTYKMTTRTDSAITGLPDSGPMNTSQTMTQVLKFTAEDVAADGTTTVRQTFQSIRVESTGPMGRLVADSAASDTTESPVAQGMRQVLAAMAGESVLIEMAPDGSVRKVSGASRIADKLAAVMAANPAAGQAGQGFKSGLTDEALKNTLEQTFPRVAVRPLKDGDTWNGELTMGNPMIGRITGKSLFTLKGSETVGEAPAARISVALVLKQDVVPLPSGPAGMVMMLGDARGEGEILFDTGKNEIRLSTMRTDLPSSVTMNAPDGSVATAHNKTTITMKMELQK